MPSVFFDTNVMVYTQVMTAPDKQVRAAAWLKKATRSDAATISVQVLNELYWTLSRKYASDYSKADAREIAHELSGIVSAPLDVAVHHASHAIHDDTGYRWWDCLLLASAQAARCAVFLTEDLQHERRVGDLTILNPFLVAPETVLGA